MKIIFLLLAPGLLAFTITVSAQTIYSEGMISYSAGTNGNEMQMQEYFTQDSAATLFNAGPAEVRTITDAPYQFFAVIIHSETFGIKKAAVYTQDEITQSLNAMPSFTFAPTSETRQISGFNCTKVVATDSSTGKSYDTWVTNDISLSAVAIPLNYKAAGGFPVQYTQLRKNADGTMATTNVTVTSISNQKPPVGIFSIPSDFDKISKQDLEAMSAGH